MTWGLCCCWHCPFKCVDAADYTFISQSFRAVCFLSKIFLMLFLHHTAGVKKAEIHACLQFYFVNVCSFKIFFKQLKSFEFSKIRHTTMRVCVLLFSHFIYESKIACGGKQDTPGIGNSELSRKAAHKLGKSKNSWKHSLDKACYAASHCLCLL